MNKNILIIAVSVIIAIGCAQKKESDQKMAAVPYLAKVNDVLITREAYMEKMNSLPEWARGKFTTEEGRKEFLDEIIKEELLYQEASKKGFDDDPAIQKRINEFTRMTLISTLLKREIEDQIVVDENETRAFYDKHSDSFKLGDEVKAQHILVDTEEEAQDILKKIMKNESFEDLAKNFSKDHSSAPQGGDLGFFARGRMVPEFEKVAFELKPGDVSDPVKTKFGYHIIKVIEKKPGKQRDFEEVKDTITKRLKMNQQKSLFESFIQNLRSTNVTEINEAVLKELVSVTPPEEGQQ